MILVDTWSQEAQDLVHTMQQLGQELDIVSLEPDGFLPPEIGNPFLHYLEGGNREGKALFFDQISVPDFWEIQGDANRGWIRQRNKERAHIVYVPDSPYRLVKAVEWLDDAGRIRSVDHYNQYGEAYAKTSYTSEQQPFQTIYYDQEGQERIIENHLTQDILLMTTEGIRFFHDRMAFYVNYLRTQHKNLSHIIFNSLSTSFFVSLALNEPGSDTLVWQEGIGDALPGNMQFILDNPGIRCQQILVPNPETYQRIQQLVPEDKKNLFERYGYAYSWTKQTSHQPQALIVTNSDQIEQLQSLVEGLPEVTFHIAAPTEMSPSLLSFIRYNNVVLHQTASPSQIDALFEICDFYFDVNHYQEVPQSIRKAFLANQLILAYTTTAHHVQYVAPTLVYPPEQTEQFIAFVHACLNDHALWDEALHLQQQTAGAFDKK